MAYRMFLDPKTGRLRGHDHYWDIIRSLGTGGEFSVAEIVAQTSAPKATVDDFIRRLARAGYLELAGKRRTAPHKWAPGGAVDERIYRVLKTPAETPSLRRDGTEGARGRGRQNMWNIIRGPQVAAGFDARELVLLAETDDVKIALNAAYKYLRHLEAAGYLRVVQARAKHRLARYKLAPGMNTGPKAPKLCNAALIYDPNTRSVIGDIVAEVEP